ncbi:NAD(P)(+) transhydrogenase (Re/Si-specific) subunit beta [Adhaeretor mobilis]|uniref:NAD(P) transhydrogenase subunit beta n=1 Tax=Adhaeretor mobilis TaxID=1930276 RepID=A0A517MRJ4_9BACT|nr:NAD(P)(+) transhydrogenase (Re/Si-specific) subunit beta [Adhaeretor mobilis]QDS97503.1 NAD(P) transhydrogenase subunit beta [Adhaeretor mobilis]
MNKNQLAVLENFILFAKANTTELEKAATEVVGSAGREQLAQIGYLVAAVLFILGIKGMTHPRTAVRGNLLGAVGMFLAVLVTLLQQGVSLPVVLSGIIVGSAGGMVLAKRVQMTQMPQLVALFNAFGGIASVLVAGAEVLKGPSPETDGVVAGFAAGIAGLIGAVTFSGSMVAAGKLQELPQFKKPWSFDGLQITNLVLLCVGLLLVFMMVDNSGWEYFPLVLLALLLGVLLTLPIGGADMPVVIALLNSYSGLAAAAAGFVISNNVLIIAGSLVGASGLILTSIMCKAMNRSLSNVLFAKMGPAAEGPAADEVYEGKIKRTSPEELAMLLDGVQRVVIVPGYGLAVAQAQHIVRDLANLLEADGVTVEYAIHPVAGRMPGHMNVLLAEADVPYEQLKEMDEINPTFSQCDVAIVIGANDVVNPVANTDPTSPIAGMPILDVSEARTVIVIKRSLSPGFAGIPNPLFAADNCLMLFGDGKKALTELVSAIKEG